LYAASDASFGLTVFAKKQLLLLLLLGVCCLCLVAVCWFAAPAPSLLLTAAGLLGYLGMSILSLVSFRKWDIQEPKFGRKFMIPQQYVGLSGKRSFCAAVAGGVLALATTLSLPLWVVNRGGDPEFSELSGVETLSAILIITTVLPQVALLPRLIWGLISGSDIHGLLPGMLRNDEFFRPRKHE
jgi:hypothetical protein